MGLYLCVFDGAEEIDGVEVGPYADYNALREFVVRELESGTVGTRFPTFVRHSDCDGEWSVAECQALRTELAQIAAALKTLPAQPFPSKWQGAVAKSLGTSPHDAFESFLDVDGEFLIDRLRHLVELALQHRLPILFQ